MINGCRHFNWKGASNARIICIDGWIFETSAKKQRRKNAAISRQGNEISFVTETDKVQAYRSIESVCFSSWLRRRQNCFFFQLCILFGCHFCKIYWDSLSLSPFFVFGSCSTGARSAVIMFSFTSLRWFAPCKPFKWCDLLFWQVIKIRNENEIHVKMANTIRQFASP